MLGETAEQQRGSSTCIKGGTAEQQVKQFMQNGRTMYRAPAHDLALRLLGALVSHREEILKLLERRPDKDQFLQPATEVGALVCMSACLLVCLLVWN